MRKLFFLILAVLLGGFAINANAQKIILELTEEDEPKRITISDQVESIVEVGKFFDKNYPGAKIDESMIDDVRKFFPKMPVNELFKKEQTIRDGVKLYRYIKMKYEDIKSKMLLPEPPPLIFDDNEYDTGYGKPYIESDETVVVQDFKKALAYGDNPQDFKAQVYKFGDVSKDSMFHYFSRLGQMLSRLEWKKLPFYGSIYDNPIAGNDGLGDWFRNNDVSVRIVTENSKINNDKTFKAALHFAMLSGRTVSALAPHKPEIDFSQSENMEEYSVFSPMPVKRSEDIIGYAGSFGIPLEITVKDVSKPVDLKATVKFTLCNTDNICRKVELAPELTLEPGEGFMSSVHNFITQAYLHVPSETSDFVAIEKLAVDGEDVLRLVLELEETPHDVEVFVENTYGIKLSGPRISINGNKVIARFQAEDKGATLEGKEFRFTISVNDKYSLRQTATAESSKFFDQLQKKISWHIIMLGFLGGLLLNLMPCVFPVLSLKLLAMTEFGAKRNNAYKKNFLFTVVGILLMFFVAASILGLMKYLGAQIGWGMQFQSPIFLSCMIFVMAFFIAYIWRLVNFSIDLKPGKQDSESFKGILTGIVLVLVATPCTAPYLGTAIGFALAGSITDIYAVMLSVALGLSAPYIFIYLVPDFIIYLPKPGKWMARLNHIMVMALILTIIWMIAVLGAQTGFWFTVRMVLYVLVFWVILAFRKITLDTVDKEKMKKDIRKKVVRTIEVVFALVVAVLIIVSAVDAKFAYERKDGKNLAEKESRINYAEIGAQVAAKKAVIVAVEADWCLTCGYNNLLIFHNPKVMFALKRKGVKLVKVDWSRYDKDVLEFMGEFGRKGLPFYIMFSPSVPDGFVLPEVLDENELIRIIEQNG